MVLLPGAAGRVDRARRRSLTCRGPSGFRQPGSRGQRSWLALASFGAPVGRARSGAGYGCGKRQGPAVLWLLFDHMALLVRR